MAESTSAGSTENSQKMQLSGMFVFLVANVAVLFSIWFARSTDADGLMSYPLAISVLLLAIVTRRIFPIIDSGLAPITGLIWSALLIANEFSVASAMMAVVLVLCANWTLSLSRFIYFSLPLIVGANFSMSEAAVPVDTALVVASNIGFVLGFGMKWFFHDQYQNQSMQTLRRAHRKLTAKAGLIESLNLDLQRERKLTDKLQEQLAQQETLFQEQIEDQTRELTDSNAQLLQQIGLKQKISDALLKSQTRLTQAIEASNLGLIDWNVGMGQFYQSAFHDVFGPKELDTEELLLSLKKLVHREDYPALRDTLNDCLHGGRNDYQLQYRVKRGEAWFWIEEFGKVVEHDLGGKAMRILGTRRSIDSEVKRNEQIRLAKAVFDHTSEGVFVLDPSGKFLSINQAYSTITGYAESQVVGKSVLEISKTPQREELYEQIFADLNAEGRWQGELLEKRFEGDYYPQWTQINAIYNEEKRVKYYAGLISDMSDRKAADEKLQYLLNYDDLTKLANRVHFSDQLHRIIVKFKDQNAPFALIVLDVDRFKRFNDSFGHDATDGLLVEIAERLGKFTEDTEMIARIGGNEFACLVSLDKFSELDQFAQRLVQGLTQKHYGIDGQELSLSFSVGIARVPEHTQDMENLVKYATLAVEKAKYLGGQQIIYFDETLKQFSRQKLELEQELRKAVVRDQIEVFYQPKLDLRTGQINSFEALVRWTHPKRGIIAPEEFVYIAEECGLITDLGRYVLEKACGQTQSWMDQGYGPLNVSVNLSARQVVESELVKTIQSAIAATGLDAQYLELELTESAIMEDMHGSIRVLKELRSLGIKISVDDFGTGYSSLNYLQTLPIDSLKVDRSFVMGIEDSKDQQAIVKAVIVLGSSLGLQIVAEGVENEAQLAFLHEQQCDFVQGYLVSKPLNTRDMQRLLEKQKRKASMRLVEPA